MRKHAIVIVIVIAVFSNMASASTVARILGSNIEENDLRGEGDDVMKALLREVILHFGKHYLEAHGIKPTEEELSAVRKNFAGVTAKKNPLVDQFFERFFVVGVVENFKTARALWNKHGGRLILSSFGGVYVASDALAKELRELEARGEFSISDPERHEKFYSYLLNLQGDGVVEGVSAKQALAEPPWQWEANKKKMSSPVTPKQLPTIARIKAIKGSGAGTVSGRILDEKEQPVAHAKVYLQTTISHNSNAPEQEALETISDQMGRYSFKNVTRGDYFLFYLFSSPGISKSAQSKKYYYPGVLSTHDARMLAIGHSSVLSGMDINCTQEKNGFMLKVHVIDAISRKPVPGMTVIYGPRATISGNIGIKLASTGDHGDLLLRALSPGKYWIAVHPLSSRDYYCRPLPFEIGKMQVSDLEIPINLGTTLSGMVILGKGIPQSVLLQAKMAFHPFGISELPADSWINQDMKKYGSIAADGSFTINGIPPVEGKLTFENQSKRPFIEYAIRIEHNEKNITESVRIEKGGFENIRMFVTAGTGSISGKVLSTRGVLKLDRLSVMVGRQNVAVNRAFKEVKLNLDSSFKFDSLHPGKYVVFVSYTSPKERSWRLGENHYVDVTNGSAIKINLPVSMPTVDR